MPVLSLSALKSQKYAHAVYRCMDTSCCSFEMLTFSAVRVCGRAREYEVHASEGI